MSKRKAAGVIPPRPLPVLDKATYTRRVAAVRPRLLKLQFRLRQASFPVLIVFGGVDGAGKHETVNRLNEWLDPRYIDTLAYIAPSSEEAERPRMWRYWRDLPAGGRIGLVLSGWYSQPLLDFVNQRCAAAHFAAELEQIQRFERTLGDSGALILKFWMYLSAEQQQQRLQTLAADPQAVWQIQPRDWKHLHLYPRFMTASEQLIETTSRSHARWQVIDGSNARARHLQVAETLAGQLERVLGDEPPSTRRSSLVPSRRRRLDAIDLSAQLNKRRYRQRLEAAQAELLRLQRAAVQTGRSTVLVFEGWDAAGKGGAIRRLVRPLDARRYRVIPIEAPNDEERVRHYLWRFWRELPRAGHLCIFDRSWYGRVLVERVEGLASETQWQRAYREINEFERELTEAGTRVLKFWLHISAEEQRARFEARVADPLKRWKLTDEDWRNRERRDDYRQAVEDMLARCSHRHAPWIVVAAEDKRHARVQIIETVCRHLQRP